MVIKCINNDISFMPYELRGYAFGQNIDGRLPLTIDKKYVVSGLKIIGNNKFYLIIPDSGELKCHPWWYHETLFSIIDKSEPENWLTIKQDNLTYIGFPELTNDLDGKFYNALEDGEESAVNVFMWYYKDYAKSHGLWYADGKPSI
jgi:hypothetical protein